MERRVEFMILEFVGRVSLNVVKAMMDTKVTFGKQINDRDITLSFPLHREKRQRNRH